MIEIPVTAAIVIIGLLFLQHNHYRFLERKEQLNKSLIGTGYLEEIKKDFEEYKKRVDALTLRAGFIK